MSFICWTYINNEKQDLETVIKLLEILGVRFRRQFDLSSYKQFFSDAGYPDAKFDVVKGRMSCAIAVIQKPLS